MITIAFIDTLGLCYDGDTLNRRGLGGSESAVISMSRELAKLGYKVYVFNDCASDDCKPGVYNGVTYEPIRNLNNYNSFDVFIGSRSVVSFVPDHMKHEFKWATDLPNIERVSMESGLRILWMHDTFCDGDDYIEDLVTSGRINKIFTLSDWHTTYITNCHHGRRRHYETLKRHIFQTRNGINLYHNEIDISAKDPDLFVYNSSVTKGMIPLVENIWPKVQERYPNAKLTIVGGFYRFRSDHGPDEQELTHRELVEKHAARGVNFTGIINQKEIADLLTKASYMIYPSAFPETFGISTLESLAYNTPLITCNQGALEETAIDLACYKMNYAIEPNVLFTEIDLESQCNIFVDLVSFAYENKYLHQQKMYACNQVKSVCEWSTVAVEWKRFFCDHIDNHYMPVSEYRKYLDINDTVNRVFNRHTQTRRSLRVRKQSEQPLKIILPVYNSENYIKRCLDSILCQDYDNYQVIVINDCSTDSTLEIVKSFNNDKIKLISRQKRMGAVYNQVNAIKEYCDPNDITILIDGDDWLFNDPNVFDYVNHLYHEGAEFTYGSCWSLADNIPLIAQPYPEHIKKNKDYRSHKFNWGMPYTHLRTFKSSLIMSADDSNFKNSEGKWYQAGGDNSVFFTAIENANPEKVVCVPEILYVYNDLNPLNDYKVNGEEQTKNANEIINNKKSDNISVVAPTMWRCKDIFKSMLEKLTQHSFIEEIIILNNEVESTPDWEVLSHPKVILTKLGEENKNYYVNPCWNKGVELSKSNKICFLNDDIEFDLRLIDKIYYALTPDKGVFGLITGEEHQGHPVITDGSIDFKKWNHNFDPNLGVRGDNIYGFGQLMFLRKENWLPIVDGLDIYFGDDYIFHSQLMKNLDNYLIVNIHWSSPMACTSADQSIVGGFFDREKHIFNEWIMNNELDFEEIKKRIDLQAQNESTLEVHHYNHDCVTPKNYHKQPDSYSNSNEFFENKQNTFGETKMNNSSTKKILLAVPTNKNIEVETFKSIYDLEIPEGYEVEFQYFYGYQIDQIRNLIAEWAKHYDYLFSVDSDIVLPKDSLKKLLEADKDVVSGLYIQRIPNTHTLEVYKATDNGGSTNIDIDEIDFSQSLHEIVGCGFGCVLIKGEVFRVMEYPHFVYKSALNHQDTVSEDTYFCIKAREYGFKIFMDVTIQCEHVGSAKFLVEPPKKYSVIIPTMWRSLELTKKALIGYIENPLVGEVILIDNDKSRTPAWSELKHEKIRLLTQEQNIFVNPAWNLGVQESKYDLICIANDDIVVDSKVFDRLKNEITVDKGIFGLNAGIIERGQPPITDGSIDLQEWRVGNNIHCFGQFMFIHKNNWLPIIDGLDVSMGEDFQFHIQLINGRKNYMICNCFFESVKNEINGVVYYGGTTSTDESIVFNSWDKEIKVYEEWFLANPAPEEYRINHLYSH